MDDDFIDLSKSLDIVLDKHDLHNVVAQVGFAIDLSGSMSGLYSSGVCQKTVERIIVVADRFDDNHSMDVWTFSENSVRRAQATPENYKGYVDREILGKKQMGDGGGTKYAPVILDVKNEYFGNKEPSFFKKLFGAKAVAQDAKPSILIFVTDGENGDRAAAQELMQECANLPIYFQFIGIGHESFTFCQSVADAYPNVGFAKVENLDKLSNDALYEMLITDELADWLKKSGATI